MKDTSKVDRDELEKLMREFPDWKEQFPEIYKQLNPYRHHKNLKKSLDDPTRIVERRGGGLPPSDYQETYDKKNARPRSNKRPPKTPRDPNPAPMQWDTVQRSDFQPKDLRSKPQLVKKKDNYIPPDAEFDHNSSYRVDYPGHFSLPKIDLQPKGHNEQLRRSTGKFDGQTTNKDVYKQWQAQPATKFGEYPVLTGSLLYPDTKFVPKSTTMETYKGEFAARASLISRSAPNISIEGDMDLHTTNRETYKKFEDAKAALRVTHQPQIVESKRSKFDDISQSKSDFPAYLANQLQPARPITPPPATIDLKFNNDVAFETEQRQQFPVRDVKQHQRPPLAKKESATYKPPSVKFETVTHTKADYPQYDINNVYQPPVKSANNQKPPKVLPKLDGITSYKVYFPKYDVKKRVRYGDPFEKGYVPPAEKFTANTTNKEVFVAKSAEIPASFKPEEKPAKQQGSHDFTTMNMVAYQKPNMTHTLDEHEANELMKALQSRKQLVAA